jgi:hypothetical protein
MTSEERRAWEKEQRERSLEVDARAILEYRGWKETADGRWTHREKNPPVEPPEKGKGPFSLRTAFWLEVDPSRLTELLREG